MENLRQKINLGFAIGWRVLLLMTVINLPIAIILILVINFSGVAPTQENISIVRLFFQFIGLILYLFVYNIGFKWGLRKKGYFVPPHFIGWTAFWRSWLYIFAALIPLAIVMFFLTPVMRNVAVMRLPIIIAVLFYAVFMYIVAFGYTADHINEKWKDRKQQKNGNGMTDPKTNAAKEECQQLYAEAAPFAEQMLRKHGEFHPFGALLNKAGKAEFVGLYDGNEQPDSKILIEDYIRNFQIRAKKGEIKAAAIIYDAKVQKPETQEKTDAIVAELEHEDGYCIAVALPYVIQNSKLLFGETFASKGENKIFNKQ